MKAKTLPVFAILMLLSLRSAVEIKFQIKPEKFEDKNAWKQMLDNAETENSNESLEIELKDIIATEADNVTGENIKKLIGILDDTKLKKVTFYDLPGKDLDKRNYLQVIKGNKVHEIKNKDHPSDSLENYKKKSLTKDEIDTIRPSIENGITFDGTFNVEEDKLPDLSGVNNNADSLELYIENENIIAAVFNLGGNRRLLIL